MEVIITTSDRYHHLLPITCYLFNKFWSDTHPVTIVGYDTPKGELPGNFMFYSLGKQTEKKTDFSNDLRRFFGEVVDNDNFIWMFDDTFLRDRVDFNKLKVVESLTQIPNVGRIDLSDQCTRLDHGFYKDHQGQKVYCYKQNGRYRLSTQPSIWNREFLLKYLKPNLSPWDFETQHSINDGWHILGLDSTVVPHNEGVTRHDIYDYNLHRIPEEVINEMKQLKII